MRISEQRKAEIVRAFQASLKGDISLDAGQYSLAELRQADELIGNRDVNEGYRLALRNRIKDLEAESERASIRKHESYIRAWNLVVGFLLGVLISVVSSWLTQ